ncbi:MAG: thiamine-phosphate kinase [bacterium]|nr:thiamine-phosphate kinase [bacterium]
MDVSVLGEFGLIDRIRRSVGKDIHRDVLVGIGDDCGVIEIGHDKLLLFTTDMLVEEVHFSQKTYTPYQIGWKALAVNISDIAAMGGLPKHCLVALGLPSNLSTNFVDELYKGISKIGAEFEVDIVGGDIVKSRFLVINISLLGEVKREYLKRRSEAHVGDKVAVTGTIGDSACGLAILQDNREVIEEIKGHVIQKHIFPYPRVREAQVIRGLANSMIDLSDGLASDVMQIAKASSVGVNIFIDKLPISPETRMIAEVLSKDPRDLALYGGEDYELLFTIDEENLRRLDIPITIIGEITSRTQGLKLIDELGNSEDLVPKGYEHLTGSN